jgi:hypothetical protein
MIGMIFQEYATGVPSTVAFVNWLDSEGLLQIVVSPYEIVQALLSLPQYIAQQVQSAMDAASSLGITGSTKEIPPPQ